jgi:hypothetical protein
LYGGSDHARLRAFQRGLDDAVGRVLAALRHDLAASRTAIVRRLDRAYRPGTRS